MKSVADNATLPAYGNGFEFKDGANEAIEYEYDENGNLTKDLNKKIADIQYNCLNLPEKVQFEDGSLISYLYAADGTKLRTTHITGNDTTTTDYCDRAVFENGVLARILTTDGYITAPDNRFHYFIQDHQGNNRVVVNRNGTVEEVNDYYPFGGLFSSSASESVQPYKYNGKELDKSNGLNLYDYGARQYDAALGRWHSVDPMAEEYFSASPYNYCGNNPVNGVDPDGRDWYQNTAGDTFWEAGSKEIPGYTNIGSTFSSPIFGGGYLNYYQNVIVSISESPVNSFATILDDLRIQRYLLSMRRSPLEEDEQLRLFNAINSRETDRWLRPLEEEACKMAATSFIGAGIGKAVGWTIGKLAPIAFGKGYETFQAFKKVYGAAGEGKAWHHIVEQNPSNLGAPAIFRG